ncbi:putative N-(5'-phosphoribosyl)anthranilate isomerase [Candidatus Tremblaya phenacola PAVE]|nr:putative N-(5'-phosphoribosyl)anthranilate isomerase [Candidatus Tremblaya phenacola PAVE]
MSHIRIKYCGFTRKKDISTAINYDIDALGFVLFRNSIRFITAEQWGTLTITLPILIQIVGVLVALPLFAVRKVHRRITFSTLQLHDDLSEHSHFNLGSQSQSSWFAVVSVKDADIQLNLGDACKSQQPNCHFRGLGVDSYVGSYGGSGKPFCWTCLPAIGIQNLMVSGGLKIGSVIQFAQLQGIYQLDVSSGIEMRTVCGLKSRNKMKNLVSTIRLNSNGHYVLRRAKDSTFSIWKLWGRICSRGSQLCC